MKIYFIGAIRGGREDAAIYSQLISYLKKYGEVLSEHIGNKLITSSGEDRKDAEIHNRDLEWLLDSEVVVAEVTTPSTGAGYELGRAVEHKKDILCLYKETEGKRLSAMISGCIGIYSAKYKDLDQAKELIDYFFKDLKELDR